MEQPTNNTPKLAGAQTTLSRRRLLKVLAAAGGAVATSSLLPGEWLKPVVEAGVLPAHAQVSFTIVGLVSPAPPTITCPPIGAPFFDVISATVSPPPPPGSRVDFIITTVDRTVDITSGFAFTDALGTANFGPTTITVTGGDPGPGSITVTFTFGAASSSLTYTDVPSGC